MATKRYRYRVKMSLFRRSGGGVSGAPGALRRWAEDFDRL